MPRRLSPDWGNDGIIEVTDGRLPAEVLQARSGLFGGDRPIADACKHDDDEMRILAPHLNYDDLRNVPIEVRLELDHIREFLRKAIVRKDCAPTQRNCNAALSVMKKQIAAFEKALDRVIATLPQWDLFGEANATEYFSLFEFFSKVPLGLLELRSHAEDACLDPACQRSAAMLRLLRKLSDAAANLAHVLLLLDGSSQDQVLAVIGRTAPHAGVHFTTKAYGLSSLSEAKEVSARLAEIVDKTLLAGKMRRGPIPFDDLDQAVLWLARLYEACGGQFTHTPRVGTRYTGEPASQAGRFILEFVQMCSGGITPQRVSSAIEQVIRYRNSKGGSF